MKLKPIDSYTKEELYTLLQQDELTIKLLQQEINDIKEILHNLCIGGNRGVIINNMNNC